MHLGCSCWLQKSQAAHKAWRALRRCTILGFGSCIPVFSGNLCELISFSAALCWHIIRLALRLRGGQAQGILLTTTMLCDTHVLFVELKMES